MLAAVFANPWRFQPNPEVYLLVAFLVGAYVYMVRVIGPGAVAPGSPVVTRRQITSFVAAMVVLGEPVRAVTRLRRRPVAAFARLDRWDGPAFGG